MKKLKSLGLILFMLLGMSLTAQTKKQQKVIHDAQQAKEKLVTTDSGLKDFFAEAAGYVIFPNVGKGGFIVGGSFGNGVVYENGKMIGMAKLKKIDVGLQAGGQAVTEVVFFKTKKDVENFKEGKFQFSAEASAVAVKSGKAVNAKYKKGVAVFALPKAGLMADASVGGQKFSFKPM